MTIRHATPEYGLFTPPIDEVRKIGGSDNEPQLVKSSSRSLLTG